MKKHQLAIAARALFGSFLASINSRFLVACLAVALTVALPMFGAHAALDADITGAVTDVTDLWGDVKVLVLGVVVFGIAIAFLRRTKKS